MKDETQSGEGRHRISVYGWDEWKKKGGGVLTGILNPLSDERQRSKGI